MPIVTIQVTREGTQPGTDSVTPKKSPTDQGRQPPAARRAEQAARSHFCGYRGSGEGELGLGRTAG